MLGGMLLLRSFYSLPPRLSKYDAREGKVMQKILRGSLTKKKQWYRPDIGSSAITMPMPTPKSIQHGGKSSRRVAVLNKLFMKHITDIMATGEVAGELLGRGIEVSKVTVAPDFLRINVFWLAKGSKHDGDTENILAKSAGKLRHELSQLRLIGSVPIIEFIKDKFYGRLMDVDLLLAKADFGNDYVPVDSSLHLKSEFMLNTQFPSDIKAFLEASSPVEGDFPDETMPPMRQDVLGLRHGEIMMKVKRSMKKSQALHRHDPSLEPTPMVEPQCLQSTPIDFPKPGEMAQFLLKRQRLKLKTLRGAKNYQPEFELDENENQGNEPIMPSFLIDDDEEDWEEPFDTNN